jgi:ankyrin repeat protein
MRSWNEYKTTFGSTEAFHEAARSGDVVQIARLADKMRDLDEKNAKGYSALMLAAYNGQLEASRYLISIGADLNSTDPAGNSILMGVAFKGHRDILELLLMHGADPQHKNRAGQDALQFAQMFGRFDCAELLQKGEPKAAPWLQMLVAWFGYINPFKSVRKVA